MTDDDIRRLREHDRDADQDADQAAQDANGGNVSCVVKTKTGAGYPTAASAFYPVETQDVTGTETAGSAGVYGGRGDTFHAYNLGTAIPPNGSPLIVTYVSNRWVFRFDG
jgi:hypothetical protein